MMRVHFHPSGAPTSNTDLGARPGPDLRLDLDLDGSLYEPAPLLFTSGWMALLITLAAAGGGWFFGPGIQQLFA